MTAEWHWERRSIWLALVASLILSVPYLLGARDSFSADDWVHLSYDGAIPPWQIWRYFSPDCVWFYRPLQALQFGWLYHAVGIQPLAYNLSLWVMHLAVCLLVYVLARHLTTGRVALLTTVLFAAQWAYADVLLWPSNFSTLQWALVTLALCILFLRYLESRRPLLLAGVYVLFVLNFCAKETAVDAPLLLAALWWWHGAGEDSGQLLPRLREAARLFAPLTALTLAYVVFHRWGIHDVYQGAVRPQYEFASPARVPRQLLAACNYLLLSFSSDRAVLPSMPRLQETLRYTVDHVFILPVLALAAWRGRDRVLHVGLLWLIGALVPTIFLARFHSSRFYYLPAFGSALIMARCGQWCWRSISALPAPMRGLRLLLSVGLVYLLLANQSQLMFLCLRIRDDSRQAGAAFGILRQAALQLPHGSLIVLKHPPESTFAQGIGVPEMVRIALRDPLAQGVVDGQHLPNAWIQRLRHVRSVFVLDFDQQPLTLRPVAPDGPLVRRAGSRAREYNGESQVATPRRPRGADDKVPRLTAMMVGWLPHAAATAPRTTPRPR